MFGNVFEHVVQIDDSICNKLCNINEVEFIIGCKSYQICIVKC